MTNKELYKLAYARYVAEYAGFARAAEIAREQAVNWTMTFRQFAADIIAAAIDAEKEKKP